MTRINIGIPPSILTDQHLLAELRELPRIPNKVKKHLREGRHDLLEDIPKRFTLSTGHVRFFYDKLLYLDYRYYNLHSEYIERGFNIEYYHDLFANFQTQYYRNTTVQQKDIQLIKERIATNIRKSNQVPRYYRKDIDKEEYIKNILKYEL